MLNSPHYLDNRRTDGDRVVGLTYRPRSTQQKLVSEFLLEAEYTPGPSAAGRIR
jgi:hypothetical protein